MTHSFSELQPPTNLRTRRVKAKRAKIKWTPPDVTDFDKYKIVHKMKSPTDGWPKKWSRLAKVSASKTAKKLKGLQRNRVYKIKMKSIGDGDKSAWSEKLKFKTAK